MFNPDQSLMDFMMQLGSEGIIGFTQSNASIIAQMASSGKVRNKFAHCFGTNGGIFAIGHVVHPKVDLAPLFQDPKKKYYSKLYTLMLESVEVDGESIKAPQPTPTVIDTGSTMAHITKIFHDFSFEKISSKHPELKYYKDGPSTCFNSSGRLNIDDFPVINFHFSNSLVLQAYPRDYLMFIEHAWCIGWIEKSDEPLVIGDVLLRNKLVVYDNENKLLGWKEYNCSSSIEVEDDTTGKVCDINAHSFSAVLN